MRIFVLSPYPKALLSVLSPAEVVLVTDRPVSDLDGADLAISYGYRHRLPEGSAINLHISLLPWGRGAHPNLFAWYLGEPHGVTIHRVDRGMDTGPILAQRRLYPVGGTLASTYYDKRAAVERLFAETWPSIRDGSAEEMPQMGRGSTHKLADAEAILESLPLEYGTPVEIVAEMGQQRRRAA